MFKQTFETSPTPHITVAECAGNLVVRGLEERQIAIHVQGGADDVALDREGETFTLTTRAKCRLACPPATTLTVRAVRGNLKVEGMQGPAAIGATYGNVDLRGVGSAALEQVFGNLSARQVMGDLRVQTTKGNARVSQVEGALFLGQVGNNLVAEGLQGGLAAERVQGNVRLGPPFSPGATYNLNASGNLTVRLPAETSLRLALRAGGKVRSSVPGLTLGEVDGETRGVLGAGEASLEARAGGNISLQPLGPGRATPEAPEFDFAADLEEMGAQIEAQVAGALAEMEVRLAESLGRIDSEKIRRQMEQAAEKTRRKAEQAAGRARQTAEREAEKARLRAERAERRWQRASGRKPRPKQEPATDEERMRVLRLVEEGKVTPEQASDLLAALEGR